MRTSPQARQVMPLPLGWAPQRRPRQWRGLPRNARRNREVAARRWDAVAGLTHLLRQGAHPAGSGLVEWAWRRARRLRSVWRLRLQCRSGPTRAVAALRLSGLRRRERRWLRARCGPPWYAHIVPRPPAAAALRGAISALSSGAPQQERRRLT